MAPSPVPVTVRTDTATPHRVGLVSDEANGAGYSSPEGHHRAYFSLPLRGDDISDSQL